MPNILTINAGSSSIRFALFEAARQPIRVLQGKLERIGSAEASMTAGRVGEVATRVKIDAASPGSAIDSMLAWLDAQFSTSRPDAIGHRVVHGMLHSAPERVTPALLVELRSIAPYDPEHLPREIELIEALQRRYLDVPQVACFDTAFHRSMPTVATQLPIPRRYGAKGIQRFGFHGLSYTYLMQELARLGDPAVANGRVVLAHLGSGASLAAVRDGRCVDTSMGFTPSSGLVMGTRSGDLDPGLMSYLALSEAMSATQFQTMINHESGLIGISQTSPDVRDLLESEATDSRAGEALALFCYQTKKWIGSFAAVLGGVDTLVFSGGIGENAPPVRWRICDGLQFLGIDIDESLNNRSAARISTDTGAALVRVIRTDEEFVIADLTSGLLGMSESGVATCNQVP
jgi:acetate kinase